MLIVLFFLLFKELFDFFISCQTSPKYYSSSNNFHLSQTLVFTFSVYFSYEIKFTDYGKSVKPLHISKSGLHQTSQKIKNKKVKNRIFLKMFSGNQNQTS